jgi:hypothetical protein
LANWAVQLNIVSKKSDEETGPDVVVEGQ